MVYHFFSDRIKIEKVEKLIANLHDKTKHVIHIKNLKQALIHGLVLKKVQRVIKFNLEAWLKTHIDMNAKLRKKAENNFEKNFFKLMSNAIFVKTMENMRKYGDIKLVITDRRKNYLVSKSNYTTKFFTETLLAIEMRKTQILRNKPVYLGISILVLSKTVMYDFWCDFVKPKYDEKAKLCYLNTDSFIVHIKIDNIYKDIAEDVKTRFEFY